MTKLQSFFNKFLDQHTEKKKDIAEFLVAKKKKQQVWERGGEVSEVGGRRGGGV